ncbi:MAG: ABC transporter permease [Clostridiales bacterium]|nr:ABC transporter permease [Clostridiales bacterium]
MTIKTLFLAAVKKQKSSLSGLFVLFLITALSMSLAVTVFHNSAAKVTGELERLGYGTLTAWVSGCEELEELQSELETLSEIDEVGIQPLVFAGYSVNGGHSDDEGQLIPYQKEQYDYYFYNEDLDGYQTDVTISQGEIYLSPAMISGFQVEVGDEIRFELSRENSGIAFTVAGFFEDPFMGSSMIDMKSFLICESDYEMLLETLEETSEFNILGRSGAMLHIFAEDSADLSVTELNQILNEQTSLGQYAEMVYSGDTISGYMLLLQNIISGFLMAFTLLLLVVILIVLANLIRNTLEQEYPDIGILKTIGTGSGVIRCVQVLQYLCPLAAGMLSGILLSIPAVHAIGNLAVTSAGVRMPETIPFLRVTILFLLIAGIAIGFIWIMTRPVLAMRPLWAFTVRETSSGRIKGRNTIPKEGLELALAIRQLITGWGRYAGVLVVSALLTLFAAVVGMMGMWVGADGEGLMNAFSAAEHDLGVQPSAADFDMTAVEELISSYTSITDEYRIAMVNGSVNGVDYTINVLDAPEWFHILEGQAAVEEDQLLVTEYVAGDLGIRVGDSVTVSSGETQQNILFAEFMSVPMKWEPMWECPWRAMPGLAIRRIISGVPITCWRILPCGEQFWKNYKVVISWKRTSMTIAGAAWMGL